MMSRTSENGMGRLKKSTRHISCTIKTNGIANPFRRKSEINGCVRERLVATNSRIRTSRPFSEKSRSSEKFLTAT